MKTKRLFFLSLILFFLGKTVCQNAFHDARLIVEKADKIREYKKKLDELKPTPSELDSAEKVIIAEFGQLVKFTANPFDTTLEFDESRIQDILNEIPEIIDKIEVLRDPKKDRGLGGPLASVEMGRISNVSGTSLSGIPSTSFLSATQIIDGAALFIKRRIKEELSVAFLERFRKRLDENDFMKHLMPSTHRLLQSIADMDNSLPSINNIAINAFQSDLEMMPENIENTLLFDNQFAEIRKDPSFKYFALPINTIKHLKLGSHPAWILQDISEKYFTDSTEFDRIVQMVVALNDNLRNTTSYNLSPDENVWISNQQWIDLKKGKGEGEKLFLGLLFQKNKNTIFSFLKDRPEPEIKKTLSLLSDNVSDYLSNLKNFEKMYADIKISRNRGEKDSLSLELGWDILQLVDKSHFIYYSLLETGEQIKSKTLYWNTYKPIAEATFKAVSSVQRKNYGGLMLNSYQILRGLSQIKNWENGKVFGNTYLQSFFYYGNFMTDVMTATNGEEVSNILNQYAAPVGSYSIKRRSQFSLSLNAYAGLFMGWETPRKPELLRGVSKTSFVNGVMAPIGLSFNFGGLGEKRNQSLSAFVSVIDIGAVLSYRWANDEAQGLPQSVEWAQVLAPGFHLMYGLPKLPLALNMGFQVAPKLRKVTLDNGNQVKNTDFWRFNIGMTTDITIFNFYSTGRVKREK